MCCTYLTSLEGLQREGALYISQILHPPGSLLRPQSSDEKEISVGHFLRHKAQVHNSEFKTLCVDSIESIHSICTHTSPNPIVVAAVSSLPSKSDRNRTQVLSVLRRERRDLPASIQKAICTNAACQNPSQNSTTICPVIDMHAMPVLRCVVSCAIQ